MAKANTGRYIVTTLYEINEVTGERTGRVKPNDPDDPDYIAPYENLTACPLVTTTTTSTTSTTTTSTTSTTTTSTTTTTTKRDFSNINIEINWYDEQGGFVGGSAEKEGELERETIGYVGITDPNSYVKQEEGEYQRSDNGEEWRSVPKEVNLSTKTLDLVIGVNKFRLAMPRIDGVMVYSNILTYTRKEKVKPQPPQPPQIPDTVTFKYQEADERTQCDDHGASCITDVWERGSFTFKELLNVEGGFVKLTKAIDNDRILFYKKPNGTIGLNQSIAVDAALEVYYSDNDRSGSDFNANGIGKIRYSKDGVTWSNEATFLIKTKRG